MIHQKANLLKTSAMKKNREEPKEQTQGRYDCNEIEPKMT